MKTVQLRSEINEHARDVLADLCAFYRLPRAVVLRVIMESVLDAASEDGHMQLELAAATRYCQRTGHVPDCWLDLEGERFEDGPDDSGHGEATPWDEEETRQPLSLQLRPPGWELSDNHVFLEERARHEHQPAPGHASLVDA